MTSIFSNPIQFMRLLGYFSPFVLIGFFFLTACSSSTKKEKPIQKVPVQKTPPTNTQELGFVRAGSQDTIKMIQVEIADNPGSREKGLMHRSDISYEEGMIFIFDTSEPRAFWMKNTPISLDILFLNEAFEIVSIAKYTLPYSEESIPSEEISKYVVEVKAGFCDSFGIKTGDKIVFKLPVKS